MLVIRYDVSEKFGANLKVVIVELTLTRSLNRDDTEGCCLLCDVCALFAMSNEGLRVL